MIEKQISIWFSHDRTGRSGRLTERLLDLLNRRRLYGVAGPAVEGHERASYDEHERGTASSEPVVPTPARKARAARTAPLNRPGARIAMTSHIHKDCSAISYSVCHH
jgi:hypothetical protein